MLTQAARRALTSSNTTITSTISTPLTNVTRTITSTTRTKLIKAHSTTSKSNLLGQYKLNNTAKYNNRSLNRAFFTTTKPCFEPTPPRLVSAPAPEAPHRAQLPELTPFGFEKEMPIGLQYSTGSKAERALLDRVALVRAGEYPREPDPEFWKKFALETDRERELMDLRYPQFHNTIATLIEIDTFPSLFKDQELNSVRMSLYKKSRERHAESRKECIKFLCQIGDVNPQTAFGLTQVEQQEMLKRAHTANAPRKAKELAQGREEFYAHMKAQGLHKRSLWHRLWNSKEDLLQARPATNEWNQSEHSAAQPRSWMALSFMIAMAIGGVLYLKYQDTRQMATATVVNYQTNGRLSIGGDFDDLIDQYGKPASTKDYRGYYPLYYFGFTKCPDICPTELHKMMAALDTIERKQPDIYRYIKPVFVTVDPLRDTQEQIAAYAENFHPRMRWLTGSHEALTKAAKAFHIYFSIPDDATPDGDYNVDHSIFFFLMDREGQLLSYYGQNKNSQEIAEAMAQVVTEDLKRDEYEAVVNKNNNKKF